MSFDDIVSAIHDGDQIKISPSSDEEVRQMSRNGQWMKYYQGL